MLLVMAKIIETEKVFVRLQLYIQCLLFNSHFFYLFLLYRDSVTFPLALSMHRNLKRVNFVFDRSSSHVVYKRVNTNYLGQEVSEFD